MTAPSPRSPFWVRLLNTPWWGLSLGIGVISGVAFGTIMGSTDGRGPVVGVLSGVFFGVFFGLFMGLFLNRMYRRARSVADAIPAGTHRAVRRAALRGPVPADPEVRAVALGWAELQLAEIRRYRLLHVVVMPLLILLFGVYAVLSEPWAWLLVVFFVVAAGYQVWLRARLLQRVELLRSEATTG